MTMGQTIRRLREEAKLSQSELAKLLGKTQQAVDSWEHDRAKPGADTIAALSGIFKVTTDHIHGVEKLEGLYLRLAKGAQEMGLDAEDVEYILSFYRKHSQ